jgi:hypothetical protein
LLLQAAELRAELSRLQAPDTKGLKEDLINALLAHLLHPSITAAAVDAASKGSAAAELVVLTAQGLQLLQQLAPAVVSAARQHQGGADHRVGLQLLPQCQVGSNSILSTAVTACLLPPPLKSASGSCLEQGQQEAPQQGPCLPLPNCPNTAATFWT